MTDSLPGFEEFQAAAAAELKAGNARVRRQGDSYYCAGGKRVFTGTPRMSATSYKRALARLIARRCTGKRGAWRKGDVRVWLRQMEFRPKEVETIMRHAWEI
jgi:hypothetical protein